MTSQVRPEKTRQVDLLAAPFGGEGLVREDGAFVISQPWALAHFGQVRLEAGWWQLECEGEEGVEEIEIRLTSVDEPLMVIDGERAAGRPNAMRFFFQKDRACWLTLLVSAWPKRRRFDALRLRRLSRSEELSLAAAAFGRLRRSKRPFAMLGHVASRLMAGAPIGLKTTPATPPVEAPAPVVAAPAAQPARRDVAQQDGVVIQLHGGDTLDPRALSVVSGLFAASPRLKAVYSDVSEDGRVNHSPPWDEELAKWFDFSTLPLFVRKDAAQAAGMGWTSVGDIVSLYGREAVGRAALPLVSRPRRLVQPLPPMQAPALAHQPSVSVVIPTKIRIDLLEACLEGLASRTDYPHLDVLIVDNESEDPRLPELLERAGRKLSLRSIRVGGGFNFSRLINAGAAQVTGEILLLLNDDVEPVEPGWLHRMVETAMRPDVGAVGARLLYPDRTLQHAGITLGIHGLCGHLWKGVSEAEAQLMPQVAYPGTRTAVTGACLAVRRDLFERVGGLDEAFPVALNDIDFCLRLRKAGLRNIYRGDAVLIHHESQSRGRDDGSTRLRRRYAVETAIFLERWADIIQQDPYGAPGVDLASESGAAHRLVAEPT